MRPDMVQRCYGLKHGKTTNGPKISFLESIMFTTGMQLPRPVAQNLIEQLNRLIPLRAQRQETCFISLDSLRPQQVAFET